MTRLFFLFLFLSASAPSSIPLSLPLQCADLHLHDRRGPAQHAANVLPPRGRVRHPGSGAAEAPDVGAGDPQPRPGGEHPGDGRAHPGCQAAQDGSEHGCECVKAVQWMRDGADRHKMMPDENRLKAGTRLLISPFEIHIKVEMKEDLRSLRSSQLNIRACDSNNNNFRLHNAVFVLDFITGLVFIVTGSIPIAVK